MIPFFLFSPFVCPVLKFSAFAQTASGFRDRGGPRGRAGRVEEKFSAVVAAIPSPVIFCSKI